MVLGKLFAHISLSSFPVHASFTSRLSSACRHTVITGVGVVAQALFVLRCLADIIFLQVCRVDMKVSRIDICVRAVGWSEFKAHQETLIPGWIFDVSNCLRPSDGEKFGGKWNVFGGKTKDFDAQMDNNEDKTLLIFM